jgi:hypothetical protein
MAHVAPLAGVLVGFERRQYNSFTDRETGEQRPGGETLWVYVAPEGGQGAPTPVKLHGDKKDDAWRTLSQDAGFGGLVDLTVEFRARNSLITAQLVEVVSAEKPA